MRINTIGFTFAKELKNIVYKGEFVYVPDKYLMVSDPGDSDGVEKSDVLDYLLGFDYTFFEKVDFNFQFIQRIIFDHESDMYEDEVSSSFSIWLSTGFWESKVEPEILWICGLNQTDWMLRPKVKYNFRPAWQLIVGMDIFGGETDGYFGRFHDKDRVYTEIKYEF